MASLNTKPGSSSKDQHTTLVVSARHRGFNLAELRKAVGGSVRRLSVAECSQWITHFTGQGLPNPPGKKPPAYAKRNRTGAARMIQDEHVEQILRLLAAYWGNVDLAALTWLATNFKEVRPLAGKAVPDTIIRQLGTAKRAGEVIRVLNTMIKRRAQRDPTAHRAATVRERT